jgi:hypothetical protein
MIQTELDFTPVHAARISLAAQQGNIHHEPSPEIGRTEGRTAHGWETEGRYKTVCVNRDGGSSFSHRSFHSLSLQACKVEGP